MYLVLLLGNHEKKRKCSVYSNHSSRKRGDFASRFLFHNSFLSGTLLSRKAVCLLALPTLYHPAKLRHSLVQQGEGSFPTAFADGVDIISWRHWTSSPFSWAIPVLLTLTSYALWTIMEHVFMKSLTVTTTITLTAKLYSHQRITLFLFAVFWPYFAGFCHPGQGSLMPPFLRITAMLSTSV